jgi:hypothetical protein
MADAGSPAKNPGHAVAGLQIRARSTVVLSSALGIDQQHRRASRPTTRVYRLTERTSEPLRSLADASR